MTWNLHGTHARDGDLALLVGVRHKHFIINLKQGDVFHTHRGLLKHDDLIGLPWGSYIESHSGQPFYLLQPALGDILRVIPRKTQILYPKDIGFILVTLGIGPGQTVLEAGTGSGALTSAFAYAVGGSGQVFTYEARLEFQKLARKNVEKLGLQDRVTFHLQDIVDGVIEKDVDAVFLDVPNPYDYMKQVRQALKPGGFFGSILPTTNQVVLLLQALRKHNFAFIEVCEILLRFYRAEADRLRPTDRMVAHTGFLIFARPVNETERDRQDLEDSSEIDHEEEDQPSSDEETSHL